MVLPDKAGRILNIAGWSDAALYGVRLITPSGELGQQGNTDWEQDLNNAALQVRMPLAFNLFTIADISPFLLEAPLVPNRPHVGKR